MVAQWLRIHLQGRRTTENAGSVPGLGRYPGERNGNLLQYTCLEKSHGQRSWTGDIPWDPERDGQELVTKQQQCVILHLTDCLSNSVMQSRY